MVVGLPEGNLLIDTPPELCVQLLREGIGRIHAVVYTHEHADHLFGLDDLRIFPKYLGRRPAGLLQRPGRSPDPHGTFDYAFDPAMRAYPAGGCRGWCSAASTPGRSRSSAPVVPLPLAHGRFMGYGFRIGDIAYCTDTNGIPPESMTLLQGLRVLILDVSGAARIRRTSRSTRPWP